LWGKRKSTWWPWYLDSLKKHFDLHCYDACELGNIDLSIYEEKAIHRQFVHGGIEVAVSHLLQQEKYKVHLLAFSIGGTIGWKAIQQGLKVASFCAVSATRLRYENEKINTPTQLFYGANDPYRPRQDWFDQHHYLHKEIIPSQGHAVYTLEKTAQYVSQKVIQQSQ